jgi:hypothetical protein
MALATVVAVSGPKIVSIFRHPLTHPKVALVMDFPLSKPLRTAPYKQQVH